MNTVKHTTDYFLRHTDMVPLGEFGRHKTYQADCECRPQQTKDEHANWTTTIHNALDKPHVLVNVKRCQRCSADHEQMRFYPLANPADNFEHWGECPETNQPVLLQIRET